MTDNYGFDIESEDFQKGVRQYAIKMMRQRPDIFEDDLLLTELAIEDESEDTINDYQPDSRSM